MAPLVRLLAVCSVALILNVQCGAAAPRFAHVQRRLAECDAAECAAGDAACHVEAAACHESVPHSMGRIQGALRRLECRLADLESKDLAAQCGPIGLRELLSAPRDATGRLARKLLAQSGPMRCDLDLRGFQEDFDPTTPYSEVSTTTTADDASATTVDLVGETGDDANWIQANMVGVRQSNTRTQQQCTMEVELPAWASTGTFNLETAEWGLGDKVLITLVPTQGGRAIVLFDSSSEYYRTESSRTSSDDFLNNGETKTNNAADYYADAQKLAMPSVLLDHDHKVVIQTQVDDYDMRGDTTAPNTYMTSPNKATVSFHADFEEAVECEGVQDAPGVFLLPGLNKVVTDYCIDTNTRTCMDGDTVVATPDYVLGGRSFWVLGDAKDHRDKVFSEACVAEVIPKINRGVEPMNGRPEWSTLD